MKTVRHRRDGAEQTKPFHSQPSCLKAFELSAALLLRTKIAATAWNGCELQSKRYKNSFKGEIRHKRRKTGPRKTPAALCLRLKDVVRAATPAHVKAVAINSAATGRTVPRRLPLSSHLAPATLQFLCSAATPAYTQGPALRSRPQVRA